MTRPFGTARNVDELVEILEQIPGHRRFEGGEIIVREGLVGEIVLDGIRTAPHDTIDY